MQTVTVSQTGTGQTAWKNPNVHLTPFNVNIQCVVTGTVTYNVETTQDNYWSAGQANPVVVVVTDAATNAQQTILDTAVTGWRLNVTAGSGTVTARATQAGITNY